MKKDLVEKSKACNDLMDQGSRAAKAKEIQELKNENVRLRAAFESTKLDVSGTVDNKNKCISQLQLSVDLKTQEIEKLQRLLYECEQELKQKAFEVEELETTRLQTYQSHKNRESQLEKENSSLKHQKEKLSADLLAFQNRELERVAKETFDKGRSEH